LTSFDGDSTETQSGRLRIRPRGESRACLIQMVGPFPGETIALERGKEITVGRAPGCDIRLPFGDVSRVHAKAKCSASGKVEIIDLGSTNGSYVNGRKQLYRVLREGDKIQFGEKTLFRFAFLDEVDEEFQTRLFGAPFLDRITSTQNRVRLEATLQEAWSRPDSAQQDLVVLVMGIDGFDLIADLLGIAVRDYFLRELSWIVRRSLAGEATLFRAGDERFATVFTGVPRDTVLAVAERLRMAVSVNRLTHQGDEMAFSLAVGACSRLSDAPGSPEEMLAIAESRCRHAAEAGGNRVQAVAAG
jgi:two-component system cell cycle response regulator